MAKLFDGSVGQVCRPERRQRTSSHVASAAFAPRQFAAIPAALIGIATARLPQTRQKYRQATPNGMKCETGEGKDEDGKDKDFVFSNKEVHVVAETEQLAHRLR